MTLPNRVDPFGKLAAIGVRTSWMGNRGCLHDSSGRIRRFYRGKRWIICLLDFKNRRRTVMSPGRYTELFFLDEATALAAGHRPCAECQGERFRLYRQCLFAERAVSAAQVDRLLHNARLRGEERRTIMRPLSRLPNGVVGTLESSREPCLLWNAQLLPWTHHGYGPPLHRPGSTRLNVLTPEPTIRALAAGYPVQVDVSALACSAEESNGKN